MRKSFVSSSLCVSPLVPATAIDGTVSPQEQPGFMERSRVTHGGLFQSKPQGARVFQLFRRLFRRRNLSGQLAGISSLTGDLAWNCRRTP